MQKLRGFSKIKNAFCQKKKRKKEKEDKKTNAFILFHEYGEKLSKKHHAGSAVSGATVLIRPAQVRSAGCPCP